MIESPFYTAFDGFGNSFAQLRGISVGTTLDPDAAAYIAAVETADGESLEPAIQTGIEDFVVGCKADGIWDAIKASCIMAGARTLAGALVPLKGTAPTNFNFVSADYDRKTGLKGDGATKYLDTNRLDSSDPTNDHHVSVFATEGDGVDRSGTYIGCAFFNPNLTDIFSSSSNALSMRGRRTTSTATFDAPAGTDTGFKGLSRVAKDLGNYRASGINLTDTESSAKTITNTNFHIFNRNGASLYSNGRLSFYSIGESIDLAALDARTSALMTAIDEALP